MTNVVPFQPRPAPAPAQLPAADEVAAAMRAIDHAVVALGAIDFDALAQRTFLGLAAEADAEPDNDADSTATRRRGEAHVFAAASSFRLMAVTIAKIRAELQEGAQ